MSGHAMHVKAVHIERMKPQRLKLPEASTALPEPELLTAVLDTMPMLITVVDADLRYRYINRAASDYLGRSSEELQGVHVNDVFGPQAEAFFETIKPQLHAGEALEWEGWVQRPQGLRRQNQRMVPFMAADGTLSRAIAFTIDLTEFSRQEQALAAQQQQLQRVEAMKAAVVDGALAAIITTDSEGNIVGFNPAAERMFGWRASEMLGRNVADTIVPPARRAAHLAGMARVAEGGATRYIGRRVEMTALRADGSEFPIEMAMWRTDVGETMHTTASIVDISERRRAAEVIERQREALRQAEKVSAMGSLLAGVAHELNNPLAIVMGRASLLEEHAQAHASLQAEARKIREAAERCGRIVRTFLDLARKKPSSRKAVQLNTLILAAHDILGYSLRSHGVSVETDLQDGLPAVHGDGDQLGQVVLNLLVNAQQAMAEPVEGRRVIRVTTGCDAPSAAGQRVWMRVTDQGTGVPEALRDRIFEPYFTTKAEGSGTGLGLAVSRTIAREHEGELLLEPQQPGAGASFVLQLPALPAHGASGEDDEGPQEQGQRSARILVVDDEPVIAEMVCEMLQGAGHTVTTAEGGQQALALLAEQGFDGIVTDLHMPGLDGAGLWRKVCDQDPPLSRRMMFMTGDALSLVSASFLKQSGCLTLNKPFRKVDLLAQVARMLER